MRILPSIACFLAASGAFLATSCSRNTRELPSPTATNQPPPAEASPPLAPTTAPQSFALIFTVDPKQTVGERKISLDIPVTDAVQLSGSCSRKNQQLILKIPAAVLRDHFDIGEATIDLTFTADITATCPAPKS
ncbi:MAG: hypothetical protein OSA48_10660 [Akkermansiaceae bacterium]|nr:hypothetical protein [Akkermansiaceae bacterium]